MTLNAALTTSTTGLSAQASAISNISNNLANSSTTAYKGTDTDFSDLVSGSSAGGVTATADYDNDVQGDLTSTSTETDLAIDGSGYFVVKTATRAADGTLTFSAEEYYTRCGDFSEDSNGYLVNSEGYYLMGWAVDTATGEPQIEPRVPIQVSSNELNEAVATATINYDANLPAGEDVTGTATASIYDSLGVAHDVTYSWALTDASTNTWTLTIGAADGSYDAGSGTYSDYSASVEVSFDGYGALETVDYGDYYSVSGTTISFDLQYEGAAAQTISCDLSSVTQYAGSAINVSAFTADGVTTGSYKSAEIDSSGNVNIIYTNGQSEVFYQIPIATFMADDALQNLTGNAYRETTSSGTATYSAAGTDGAGSIASSTLEGSNVDLASEFTDLVSVQQVYSANAKVVSAVSEMMKVLIDLQ
ncbi:MAG: flagellar hook protein FlgE [Alphaproteobacteria bacterium]|nr:flagellar hook protein FlgE [Alphaproteobacteria bacterium]